MLPKCPSCYYAPSVHSSLTIDKLPIVPNAGDISVCFKCGSINTFTDTLDLEKCTDEKLIKMMVSDPFHYFVMLKISEEIKNMRLKK